MLSKLRQCGGYKFGILAKFADVERDDPVISGQANPLPTSYALH